MSDISPDASKRMCKHMNEDHGLSVYAMVISTLDSTTASMKISNCKLEEISLTKMHFSYVACDDAKGVCMPKTSVIRFDQPLQSSAEARPRLVDMHHQSLAPKFIWLITDSIARTVILLWGPMFVFYIMGFDTFAKFVESIEQITSFSLQDTVSIETAFSFMEKTAKFVIVSHLLEGLYVIYLCLKLKLKISSILCWFFMVFMAGLPMTKKVMNFVKIQNESSKKDD